MGFVGEGHRKAILEKAMLKTERCSVKTCQSGKVVEEEDYSRRRKRAEKCRLLGF